MVLGRFLAVYYAAVREHSYLAPGETAVVQLVCPDRRQAGVLLDYAEGGLSELSHVTIARRTLDTIEIDNQGRRVAITVATADFRSVRGYSVVAALVDEAAFLDTDSSASPDVELVRALLPALATTGGPLILSSSPYAQRGELFKTHSKYWGQDNGDVLAWLAPSLTMNPTLNAAIVRRALEDDPEGAAAEWNATFRSDVETFLPRAALEAVVVKGRHELPPVLGRGYVAFLDPSGGSSDSFTLGIAHRDEQGRPILDLLREVRPPFSPEAACRDFVATMQRYNVRAVFSDAYAGAWVTEGFSKLGITITISELNKSAIYLEALPLIMSATCELLDNPRLYNQLVGLERRVGRSGRDSVDHAPGGHDDVANAACGALVSAIRSIYVKAPLPATFDVCVNHQSSAARSCPFLKGFRTPHLPSDPHCVRHCVGLRAVRGPYDEYRRRALAAGDKPLLAGPYLKLHWDLESAPLTRRAAWTALLAEMDQVW
jgi:hypothetical protein